MWQEWWSHTSLLKLLRPPVGRWNPTWKVRSDSGCGFLRRQNGLLWISACFYRKGTKLTSGAIQKQAAFLCFLFDRIKSWIVFFSPFPSANNSKTSCHYRTKKEKENAYRKKIFKFFFRSGFPKYSNDGKKKKKGSRRTQHQHWLTSPLSERRPPVSIIHTCPALVLASSFFLPTTAKTLVWSSVSCDRR